MKIHNCDPESSKAIEFAIQIADVDEEHDLVANLPTEQNFIVNLDLTKRLLDMESLLRDVVHENIRL